MTYEKYFCFSRGGEDIYLFILCNTSGTKVSISNYGAIIRSFKIIQNNNRINDIVLGFDKMEDYFSPTYLSQYSYIGAACGRYANRIKDGRFSIDGKNYQLTQNEGNDQLHGGREGFDKKIWQLVSFNNSILELSYSSPDGEERFPGNLTTHIRFELNEQNELSYEFSARTDKATAVNLTHHSYFNLNNGIGTIEDHEVKINASRILAQDEGLVCNGDFIPVEGTRFDFRNFKAVLKDGESKIGYDQCFVIDKKDDELCMVAETRSLQSGITLQVFSTAPAVQFYTAQGFPNLRGKQGNQYGPFSGLCLETHTHPNAINIPHFPNTVIRPGEIYRQKNIYRVSETAVK